MTGYTVYFVRGDGAPDPTSDDTAVIEPDQIIDPDLPRSHSEVNEWQFMVPLSKSLDDWRMSEMYAEYEARDGTSELIYRGRLDTTNHDEGRGLTTLRGECVAFKLKHGSAQVHYEGITVRDAISDYWERTPFDATVEEADPQPVDEDKTIQSASTTSEFEALFAELISDTDPISIENGSIRQTQTAFVIEAEDEGSGGFVKEDDAYSGGEAFVPDRQLGGVFFSFTPEYDIPPENLVLAVREGEFDGGVDVTYEVGDDSVTFGMTSGKSSLSWFELSSLEPTVVAGETVQVIIELQEDPDGWEYPIDAVAVFDDRFGHTLDNQVHEPGGYLDGPELYPDSITTESETYEEEWNPVVANLEVTANDTGGDFALGVSNDDGETYDVTSSNNPVASGEFASIGSLIKSRVTLSRIVDSAQNQTPRFGYEGQEIGELTLSVDTNDLAIYNDRRFVGSDLENINELHDDAGFNWITEFHENQLVAKSFPRGALVDEDLEWTTLEGVESGYETRGYRNVITCYGAFDEASGEYIAVEARAEDEIQRFIDMGYSAEDAEIEGTIIDPDLETVDDIRQRARQELLDRVAEDEKSGVVPIVPKAITPGVSYRVPELAEEGEEAPVLPAERVEFQDGQDPRGAIHFEDAIDIATVVRGVSKDVRRTKRAIR